jgi:hypothetical protein
LEQRIPPLVEHRVGFLVADCQPPCLRAEIEFSAKRIADEPSPRRVSNRPAGKVFFKIYLDHPWRNDYVGARRCHLSASRTDRRHSLSVAPACRHLGFDLRLGRTA